MLLCCEGKCMFSMQRFMPHNYSMNLNLAFIPTLDLFALKSLVVKKKKFRFLNLLYQKCLNDQKNTTKSFPFVY